MVEQETSSKLLPKQVPSETEMEFALSLVQHIYYIMPKGQAAVYETRIDTDQLSLLYAWFKRAVPSIRRFDLLSTDKSPLKSLTPKASTRLSLHSSMSLDILASIDSDVAPEFYSHHGWQPIEVSDAISCIYESYYELPEPPSQALSEYTYDYFHGVYFKSNAICKNKLEKFIFGILAHHMSRDFGMRIHIFGILCGIVKLDFDMNRIACHPKALHFVLKVMKEFLPRSPTLGSQLRTDTNKTMVPCIGPDSISFRSTIRKILNEVPKGSNNTDKTMNVLLHELESGCVRYKGFQMIDLDWLVMKMLTYWCKSYGGFNWFKVEALFVPQKSRGGSRKGKRSKDVGGSNNVGGGGNSHGNGSEGSQILLVGTPKHSQEMKEKEEKKALPTPLQMEEFKKSRAGTVMLEWTRAMRDRIRHRVEMAAIEEAARNGEEDEGEVKKEEFQKGPGIDLFADENEGLVDPTPPKPTLPTITYQTKGLKLGCVNYRDKETGDEISFEEYRQWSDNENRKKSLSLILRTRLNQTYSVRAAPFDCVGDVVARSKLAQQNPDKHYVVAFDGLGMDNNERLIKYGVQNNACLRLYEYEEWLELQFVKDTITIKRDNADHRYHHGGHHKQTSSRHHSSHIHDHPQTRGGGTGIMNPPIEISLPAKLSLKSSSQHADPY